MTTKKTVSAPKKKRTDLGPYFSGEFEALAPAEVEEVASARRVVGDFQRKLDTLKVMEGFKFHGDFERARSATGGFGVSHKRTFKVTKGDDGVVKIVRLPYMPKNGEPTGLSSMGEQPVDPNLQPQDIEQNPFDK